MKKITLILVATLLGAFLDWLFHMPTTVGISATSPAPTATPGPAMPQAHGHVRPIWPPEGEQIMARFEKAQTDQLLAKYGVSRDDGTITSEEIVSGHPPVEWPDGIYKIK